MALVAELDMELGLGRAGGERVATRAPHLGLDVVGMDVCLHGAPIQHRPAGAIPHCPPGTPNPGSSARTGAPCPVRGRSGYTLGVGVLAISARNSSLLRC